MIENLKIAISSALLAGFEILKIYNESDINIDYKNDNSPLTNADISSNRIIISQLSKTKLPILSEESKIIDYSIRKSWKTLWIVDPIDGTKEFIKKNGEFTVNIALIQNKKPVLGVIFAPVLGDLYYSLDGLGSFKLNIAEKNFKIDEILSSSIKLSKKSKLNSFTVIGSKSHMNEATKQYIENLKLKHKKINIISAGSSLKFCLVAEGKANCYPRFGPTMEWDTAAGQSICINAGFKTIDQLTGDEISYNRKVLKNNSFLVSENES